MAWQKRLGDRREGVRFEIVGDLFGTLETIELLPLRNIGRGGALVEARLPLPVNSMQRVRFAFEDQHGDIQVRVCRVEEIRNPVGLERYLVGLEFLQPPPETLEVVERLMAESGGTAVEGIGHT